MDKCHNGQVWSECTQCEKSCTHREIDCLEGETAEDCDEGCACPSDQAWDGHHCVPVEECPCIRNGDKYQVGETVEQHCQKWYELKTLGLFKLKLNLSYPDLIFDQESKLKY